MATATPPPSGPSQRRRPRDPSRQAVWLILLALLTIIVTMLGPSEMSRWHLAAAMENELSGNPDEARRLARKALDWDRSNLEAYAFLSDLEVKEKRPDESLKVIAQIHKFQPPTASSLQLRASAYQHLSEHQLAIEDWRTIVRQVKGAEQSPSLLNTVAYARALGERELDEALKQINEANRLVGADWIAWDVDGYRRYVEVIVQTIHAKRKFFTRQERYHEVIRSLSHLVKHCTLTLKRMIEAAQGGNANALRALPGYKNFVASVLLHRSRIFSAMELPKQAEQDRKYIVDHLKVKLAQVLPPNPNEDNVISAAAAFLDTRGLIYLRMGRAKESLYEFERAIRLFQVARRITEVQNKMQMRNTDGRRLESQKKTMNHSIAVMYKHRGEAYQALNKGKQAAADFDEVRRLGFDPNDETLF